MKLLKTLTLGLLAAALAGTASATPTIIHVSGSTAFRTGATIAIMDTLTGTTAAGGAGSGTIYGACSTSNVSSAGQQIFANGTIGTGGTATIIVETAWTGSLAGVVDLVVQTSTASFYDETNANVIAAVNASQINVAGGFLLPASGQSLTVSGNSHVSSSIEMAMTDSVKTTVGKELSSGAAFATGYTNIGSFTSVSALATACGGSSITDAGTSAFAQGAGVVAIVPFQWVIGNVTGGSSFTDGSSFTIPTNINQQVARELITAGYVPQALFTGLNTMADTQNFFFFTGRNEDSGTRIGYLMESQFGVTGNPVQWAIGDGTTTTTGTTLYPITALNTEPSIVWNKAGHSGYAGGGNVSTALKLAENGSVTFASGQQPSDATGNCYFISSLGITDAATTATGGGHILNYNGVAYSPAAVQNGTYTHWEFEHCYRLAAASTAVKTFVNNVADNIFATDCDVVYSTSTGAYHTEQSDGSYDTSKGLPVGVKYDGFCNVTRSTTEGGPVSPQY